MTTKDKKLSLAERWKLDAEDGAYLLVYRCRSCAHYQGGNDCDHYGEIPSDVSKVLVNCTEFKPRREKT